MSRDRRAEADAARARPAFVDALRAVLGLGPLVGEGRDEGPVYHAAWPEPRDGCRRVTARIEP